MVVKESDKIIGSVDFNNRHEDDVLRLLSTPAPRLLSRSYVPEAARTLIDQLKALGLRAGRIVFKLWLTMSKVNESQRSWLHF